MSEVDKLAILLFDRTIEQGQQAAIAEKLNELGLMPYKSKWEEMGEEDKDFWRAEAKFLIDAGYHQVEEVQLEVLAKEEMRKKNDAQPADAKYGDVFEAITQATIAHNEAKGKLYRRVEEVIQDKGGLNAKANR